MYYAVENSDSEIQFFSGKKHLFSYCWDFIKPYLHPVNTLDGHTITLLSPHDHIWHLGLFFSWKFINGINFWEKGDKNGLVLQVNYALHPDPSGVTLRTENHYEANGVRMLSEDRSVRVHGDNRYYFIDFDFQFHTDLEKVTFDRTPLNVNQQSVLVGGYAGLSYRPNRSMYPDAYVENANGQKGMECNAQAAKWIRYMGKLDGGKDVVAGLAILDHPGNFRHPSPFFARDSSWKFGFINAAFIFHEPYTLRNNERLTLKYRVLVHDHSLPATQIQQVYDQYISSS